jgi:anti-sigma regulatory factor (Ser/Thr protein kinase)
VDKIQQRAQDALVKNLNLDAKITMRFTMALSEVCQNIVEHAGRGGRWPSRPIPGECVSADGKSSSSPSRIRELDSGNPSSQRPDSSGASVGTMVRRWKRP